MDSFRIDAACDAALDASVLLSEYTLIFTIARRAIGLLESKQTIKLETLVADTKTVPLRILAIGAHPDDCELKAGGVAVKYVALGHRVRFVSMTNGDTGHHIIGGGDLARRRCAEAAEAARVAGVEHELIDMHCGELMPTLENRRQVIRMIRQFQPDLIMTHRPNDYHPDHRYTSQLVQDACYLVTVPNNLALTPHLESNPVVVYFHDSFKKPIPFMPDVVVDVTDVAARKLEMIACHDSQMFEWLPYNQGVLDQMPADKEARLNWLKEQPHVALSARVAEQYRSHLENRYGAERAAQAKWAEAFEACEFGGALTAENLPRLFPF